MLESHAGWQQGMDAFRLAVGRDDRAAAEAALRAAIAAAERALPADTTASLPLSDALFRLGELLSEDGRAEEREGCFRGALAARDRLAPGEDHGQAAILGALAASCVARGGYTEAEPLLLRLLDLKRAKGESHPEVATVLASLASVRQALGNHESAELLWRKVVEIRAATLAPNHVGVASALERLAESCAARGGVEESLRHLRRALAVREATLGVAHPSVRAVHDRIADLQLQASEELGAHAPPRTTRPTEESALLAALVASVTQPMEVPIMPAPLPAVVPPDVPAPVPAPPVVADAPPPPERLSPYAPPMAGLAPLAVGAYAPAPAPPVSLADSAWSPTSLPRSLVLPSAEGGQPLQQLLLGIERELEGEPAVAGPATQLMTLLRSRAAMTAGGVVLLLALVAAASRLTDGASGGHEPTAQELAAVAATPATPATPARPALIPVDARTTPLVAAGSLDADASLPVPVATGEEATTRPAPSRAPRPSDDAPRAPRAPNAIALPTIDVGTAAAITRPTMSAELGVGPSRILGNTDGNGSIARGVQPARLIGAVPVARYPQSLRESGIEGAVRVTFEVDTLGVPDMSTFTVLSSDHRLFTSAVRSTVPSMRFVPAEANGRRTRWLVRMPFEFSVSKDRE